MIQINKFVAKTLTLVLLLAMVTPGLVLPKQGVKASDSIISDLSLEWATGIISDGVGPAGIIVADLDQDGITDIVSSSCGSVYVLNETAAGGDYYTKWYSEDLLCTSIATGDSDEDGIQEIYAGSFDSMVYIFRSDTFENTGVLSLPTDNEVNDIAVADVDTDGIQEIIAATSTATLVYNANTLNLEWEATGKGGNQLGIGDIDGDLKPEIVVNSNSIAHALNALLQIEKWAYAGGFGIDMDVGDVDGDGVAEIAYIKDWEDAYVFEAGTFTDKWHLMGLGDLNKVTVADVDNNGTAEVLIGNGQWGSVRGYRGSDGSLLWSISNPQHGVFGIGVGDADNDGTKEILWGAGLSDSGKDVLFVGDWKSKSVKWKSDDLDGPLYVAAGDIDTDGQVEIVMASRESNSGYNLGIIYVYNGVTHQIEWSITLNGAWGEVRQLAIGQLDTDLALEILIGYDKIYDPKLITYDGLTHNMEWESSKLQGEIQTMVVRNIDDDPVEEVIVGLNNNHVLAFNGASPLIQWDSGALDGYVRDLDYGDLDGNSASELAVLTNSSVYVYEVGTWTQKLHRTISDGSALDITNGDSSGSGELLIATSKQIMAWDGINYEQLWQIPISNATINAIASADLEGDGDEEFVLMGYVEYPTEQQSLLIIASQIATQCIVEYESDAYWGSFNGMALADADNDGQTEAIFGSRNSIEVYSISEAPPYANFAVTNVTGLAPLALQFTDESIGNITSWSWDFNNDGTVDSTEQNPFYTYTEPGLYSVSLTVTGPTGTNTVTSTSYIQVIGLQTVLSTIEDNVSQLRELSSVGEVTTEFITREELGQRITGDSEDGVDEINSIGELFLFLGLIDEGDNFNELVNDFNTESILGYYNNDLKTLYVVSDAEKMTINDEFTLAHEYTHSLQDQHFDLGSLLANAEDDSEYSLAVQCLVEGDASLLQGIYYWQVFDVNERAVIDQQSEDPGSASQDIPPVILETVSFPYEAGVEFVAALYKKGGWQAVNQAYSDPPRSAEQIIHPEKYLNRDEPQKVVLPDMKKVLGSSWEEMDNDVFGELGMRLYLETFIDTKEATSAAEGWGGDRYTFLKNTDGRKLLAMRSVWDSSLDAQEFFNIYIAFVDKKSGGTWDLLKESEGIRWWQTEGSTVYLSKTEKEVLVVLAPDEATAGQVLTEFPEFNTTPQADFSASLTQITAGQAILFTDISSGSATGWEWDFDNDGKVDSTEQNPSHIYDIPGKYTVSLKITTLGGVDTEIKSDYIMVEQKTDTGDDTEKGGDKESSNGLFDCSCNSDNKGTSTVGVLTGWTTVGLVWGSGYYLVRRTGRRRK